MPSGARVVVSTRSAGVRVTSTCTRSATAVDEMLAVVEDQQRRSGADLVDDPADEVGTAGRGRGEPAGDRLADAEHVADLDRDAFGRGDAGELDEVHDGLLGEPAHQVGEPGLAEPTGADDRGDPGGADRLGQRGDVLVAADQPRRLEEQTLADRVVAGQQLGVQRPQRRARVDAEPVGQVGAVALVALQCGRHAVHGRDRAQQRGDDLVVRLRALQQRQRRGVLTGGRQPETLRAQRPRVDVGGGQGQPVAAGGALDDLRAGRGPRPGDHDLERLGRVGGDVVAPDLLDQRRLGQAARAGVGEAPEQRVGPLPRDRLAVPGDVVEDREPRSRRPVSAGRHRSARRRAPRPRHARPPSPPRSGCGRVRGSGARRPATCGRRRPGRRCRRRRAGSTRAARRRPRAAPPRPSAAGDGRASTTRATSSLASGYVEKVGAGRTSRGVPHQEVEVDLDRRDCGRAGRTSGRPWGAARRRGRTRRRRPGAARRSGPGATARARPRRPRRSTPSSVPSRRDQCRSRRPSRPRDPRPTSRRARARRRATSAEVQRLLGQRLEQLGRARRRSDASRRRRSAPGRGPTGNATVPVSKSATPVAPRPRLRAAALQQPGQQRRRVRRLLARERVGQPDASLRSTSSAGRPSASNAASPTNGKLIDLDAAGTGEGAADPAAQPLLAGEPTAGGLARQHRRDLVVADDPGDLLDQVERVGEVGAPRRRGRGERGVAVSTHAADGLEVGDRGRGVDRHAGRPGRAGRRHRW